MAEPDIFNNPNFRVYSERIGQKGMLYMADNGSYCTFYLQVEDPTFTKALKIKYGYPSTVKNTPETWTYPAGGKLTAVRSNSVFTSGDCFLTIMDTGTTQLGKGGTLLVQISRNAKVPPPPDLYPPIMMSSTSVRLAWNNRQALDSGGYITQIDIAYSTTPNGTKTIKNGVLKGSGTALSFSGTYTVTGLKTNTEYYFFVRARTAVEKDSKGRVTNGGAGPWSEARGILTSGGVMVRHKNRWYNAIPYVKTDGVWKKARAYFKSSGSWKMTR